MGAMLVSMALSIPIMMFIAFFTIVLIAVLAYCAYKIKMSVLWWLIAAIVMNFWVVFPFVFAYIKIDKAKCPNCGANKKTNTGICPCCGDSGKKFDDKKFIKRTLLVYLIVIVIYAILETVIPLIIKG
ncbi:MAG: hypothetical protein IJ447_08665 [Clostridia bacterium]|nr:hypothetical protein [Clostridia bacterium]